MHISLQRTVTVVITDDDDHQMYFFRKSDRTFWDKIHVPSSEAALNGDQGAQAALANTNNYVPVSYTDFLA